ncbi:hypothetical protein KFK09_010140 [Dendrobium nobile]|uniref:DNA 5'-3' helicase FANCJ n=1 Tax=Dendrobium nobile TaxID=94219 RepID=A0A8T3BPH5_DENNO|nr:hypothetical protein KFK09_010140 [Dendrobium nobile]
MDTSNTNPILSSKSNIYHISGVPVEFPYKPYGSQLAFMSRVISTLDRARRQGHCHALLESPTGTGKTLSLLCASLAWQQKQSLRHLSSPASIVSPNAEVADPLLHGGGFIPDPDASGNPEMPQQGTKAKTQKRLTTPNIYYASRTHSQISQVIREYRKTSYRVPMAVLASRKHYCTNKYVCGKENVDEVCKLLLKDQSGGCLEFKNANKVKSHPSLQIGGCFEVHDIEDLVRIGQRVKGCSYFAAQTLAAEAQLVFCPYSYIINPIVRRAMDVDIKGCIIILDEAHNIEDMAREGGSVDIEEEVLHALQVELGQLCRNDNLAVTYRPLYDVIEGIVGWINMRKDNLQKCEFEHYLSSWTGEKATQELQQGGISQQSFPVLQECATKAIKAASDAAPDEPRLTGISLITLEGLFSSLSYFFSGNGCHANDYQLALQRYVKRDGNNAASDWTISLSLWCLNPAVVFKEIAELSLSVILTSGTLSPVSSFSSELGVRFDTCMEAPHVINTESQLWAAVFSSGVGNIQLNASYRSADSYAFQDSLGATLEEICKIVPGGALVFFPSYKLLEKLQARWHQTGQWSRLNAQKDLFIEPRGSTNEFEPVLRGYYDTIYGKSKNVPGKVRLGLKRSLKHSGFKDSHQNLSKGAAFLAVCRGKVSEGIDFSDDNARVVVIVGIPFPNKNDIQVMLKKKFNDTYRSSKNLISGSEWYCHQAFRALNQAAGRCIRHRFDYGAIILLDERYREQRNLAYISKWLRSSIKSYKSFDDSLEGLQTFFKDTKQLQILDEDSNDLTDLNNNKGNSEPFKSSKQAAPPKGNQKINKSSNRNENIDSDKKTSGKINQFTIKSACLVDDSSLGFQPKTPTVKRRAGESNEKILNCCTNNDSENKSLNCLRFQSFSPGSSPDLPMVIDEDVRSTGQDTYPIFHNLRKFSEFPTSLTCGKTSNGLASQDVGILSVTPAKIASSVPSDPKLENLSVLQNFHQFPEIPSSSCGTTANEFASQDIGLSTATPKKLASSESPDAKQSQHCVMSVSSCNQKKRRLKVLQKNSYPEMNFSNLCFDESIVQFALPSSINVPRNIDPRTEYSLEDNEKVKLELFKSENQDIIFQSSDICTEIKLHVCCSSCKYPLGLPENRFLVKSLMILSSKLFLSYIRIYGTHGSFTPECLSKTPPTVINVLSCEILSINELIIKGNVNNFSKHGIWCEEDGCVFKAVFCPFCKDYDTCLGVHVLATDASNASLLNKVLFYTDCLCISEPKTFDESTLPKNVLLDESSDHIQNEKYTPLEEPACDTKQKPAAIMKYTDNPQAKKPAFSPKERLVDHKNSDSHQPKPIEIEKFTYQPQTKPANFEKFPSNIQKMTDQTVKFGNWSQPRGSHSSASATTKSKLKLPKRQENSSKK